MSSFKGQKEYRFLKVLLSGKTVSRKQARTNYRIQNASATVDRFVKMGYTVEKTYKLKAKTVSGFKIPIRTVSYSISA